MKKKSPATLCLIAVLLVGILWRLQAERTNRKLLGHSDFLFGTVIVVSLYNKQDEAVPDEAFQLLRHYKEVFSSTKTDSELYHMNHRGSGVATRKTSPAMLDMIKFGPCHSGLSGGAFDVTVLPLSSLWNFSGDEPKLPSEVEIQAALTKVDYRCVHVERDVIDFGDDVTQTDSNSMAKGYIADHPKDFLVEKGVKSTIISLGGNVLYIGKKVKGKPFQITIWKPEEHPDDVAEILNIDRLSVVSSSVYKRCFDIDDVHYHHILNPRTNHPYQNGITPVTIAGPNSTERDALPTAVFSLEQEAGMTLLNRIEDYYGYMILEDDIMLTSKGVQPSKNP